MNRAVKSAAFMSLMCSFVIITLSAHAADLGYLANSKKPIKVFFKDFYNDSGQNQVTKEEFCNELAKSFANRKSVSFSVVKSPQESDVQVSARIKSYEYLEKDPVRPSPTYTMVLDALTTENFAEMSVEFTVVDTPSGKTIWNNTITSYVKRMMTPVASIPIVCDKVTRNFVSRCFGKGQ